MGAWKALEGSPRDGVYVPGLGTCSTDVKEGRKWLEERKPSGSSQAAWAKPPGLSARVCDLCQPRGPRPVSQLCRHGDSNMFPLSSVAVSSPVRWR